MDTTILGSSGLEVSRICLGTWQAHGWVTSPDSSATYQSIIHAALDSGINFIDTAPAYGNGLSEKMLGEALKGRREQVILATKVGHSESSPEKIRSALEGSLQNLQTDYIDLYQQHWPGKKIPLEETISALEQLKAEGKIRAIGVSNWEEREFDEISAPSRIDSFQPCYNLLWRRVESALIPLCKKHDIGVIPYSPLCQGLLTGRFRKKEEIPNDPRKQNVLTSDEVFPLVLTFLDTLEEVAETVGKSPAQVALAWLLQQPAVTSVIVGCSNQEQVLSASESTEWKLSSEELNKLTEASDPFLEKTARFKSLWNWHPRR